MNGESIAKTGFLTSVLSYVLFWGADLVRPGFVARYLSVHLFLLSAVLFGIWWMAVATPGKPRGWLQYPTAIGFGILACVLVWNAGEGLAEYRILMSGLAAIAPAVVVSLARSSTS